MPKTANQNQLNENRKVRRLYRQKPAPVDPDRRQHSQSHRRNHDPMHDTFDYGQVGLVNLISEVHVIRSPVQFIGLPIREDSEQHLKTAENYCVDENQSRVQGHR